ncbi:proteinase-activated receptor 4 [Poecilia reticulata]|uniref:F2R like thrombin or trypsin receptor 3 n=1 Tax=Poecilia reticulata TaxID=8081 RepID=A0A3P9P5C1_POERE|nr:PREDICTED: proteinase-activated receptor 4 [Poecilia reticulata]XP_017162574.1 PREDICTED: proteinase-activated receptor 4 [Poecilia reticulata]
MKCLVGTLLLVSALPSLCTVAPPPDSECGMSYRLRTFRVTTRCNLTTLKEKQVNEIKAWTTNLVLPIVYLFTFCVGLPTNLLALWILVFRTKRRPLTTLLINLTVIDCLLLLVLPFRIVYLFRGSHWELGEPLCRIVMAMLYGNMYSTVWSLAFVAVDRYVAVVHPFGAKSLRSRRWSLGLTAAVWVVMLAAMLPLLLSQQTYPLDDPKITTCHDALPESVQENYFLPYFATLFTTCFLLPFVIVMFCHSAILRTLLAEGRKYCHTIRVMGLMIMVFIVFLLPCNVLLILTYSDSWPDGEDLYIPYMISLTISTYNSSFNPYVFYDVCRDCRERTRNALCCVPDMEDIPSSQGTHTSSSARQRSKVTLLAMTSYRGRLTQQPEVNMMT